MATLKEKYLVDGAIVRERCGCFGVVVGDHVVRQKDGFHWVREFDDNLNMSTGFEKYDIVAVYNSNSFDYNHEHQIIWQRPKTVLDKEERKYLRRLIAPFRNRVKSIMKETYTGKGYEGYARIRIEMYTGHVFELPVFNANKMYVGMKFDVPYNIEELELFEK